MLIVYLKNLLYVKQFSLNIGLLHYIGLLHLGCRPGLESALQGHDQLLKTRIDMVCYLLFIAPEIGHPSVKASASHAEPRSREVATQAMEVDLMEHCCFKMDGTLNRRQD